MRYLLCFILLIAGCTSISEPGLDKESGFYSGGGKFLEARGHTLVKNYYAEMVLFGHGANGNGTLTFTELPDKSSVSHYELFLGPEPDTVHLHRWKGHAFDMDRYSNLYDAIAAGEFFECAFSYDSVYGTVNGGITMPLGGVRGRSEIIGARRKR